MSSRNWSRLLCSYKDCKNSYNEKDEGTNFFRFSKHENLCKMWLQACGREDLPALDYMGYYKTRRLCSKHFEDRMYMGIVGFVHPCKNFPLDYLLKLFIRLHIYYILKYSNRNFKHCTKRHRKLCILTNMSIFLICT